MSPFPRNTLIVSVDRNTRMVLPGLYTRFAFVELHTRNVLSGLDAATESFVISPKP